MKINDYILSFLGILLILISIGAFFNVFYLSSAYDPYGAFWICFSAVPIVGIGLLFRKTSIIKSQLYILAIPDLIWMIDFISYIIRGSSFFGIADYFSLSRCNSTENNNITSHNNCSCNILCNSCIKA